MSGAVSHNFELRALPAVLEITMKGFTLIAVIFGSILGGAVGGYGASQLAPVKTDASTRKAAVIEGGESHDEYAKRIDDQDQTIRDLTSKIAGLNDRLDKAAKNAQDTAAIDKKIEDVNATLAKVKEKVENQPAPSGDGVVAKGPVSQDDFDKMADAREKRQQEEERAKREKEMTDRMAKRNVAIVDNMDKKLQLQPEQKEKLTKLLEAQNAKFADLGKKGQEARDAGIEFDWRKEMQTLSTETLTAVRNELTPGQQAIFDEATKESGMRAFEPQGGGMGPGGTGGRRGGGNGGGGN
jgi:predicted RNase H-like nuclease (RuvC/YqgF family)